MPIGPEDINQFQNLSEDRTNVFVYDGSNLFPLRLLKCVSAFAMDLLPLY